MLMDFENGREFGVWVTKNWQRRIIRYFLQKETLEEGSVCHALKSPLKTKCSVNKFIFSFRLRLQAIRQKSWLSVSDMDQRKHRFVNCYQTFMKLNPFSIFVCSKLRCEHGYFIPLTSFLWGTEQNLHNQGRNNRFSLRYNLQNISTVSENFKEVCVYFSMRNMHVPFPTCEIRAPPLPERIYISIFMYLLVSNIGRIFYLCQWGPMWNPWKGHLCHDHFY